jgi:steroid Delta-isomerase
MKKKPIDKYIELFSDLTIDKVKDFDHIVDPNIEFTDPFNVVKGLGSFKNIFNHMFKNIKDPKFKIIDYSIEKKRTFLKWEMTFFAFKSKQIIVGISEIKCGKNGKIIAHHDYWDSMNGIFIKLPFIGFLYKTSLRLFSLKN